MQAAMLEQQSNQLAEHLIALPGSQWALWRWICLRGAGFPAREVLRLAASAETILATEDLLRAEQATDVAGEKVIQEVAVILNQYDRREDRSKRAVLRKIRDRVKERVMPPPSPQAQLLPSLAAFEAALQRVDHARAAFRQEFSKSVAQTSLVLREVASDPRFREAVTWQNRAAIHSAIGPLLNLPENASRSSRQKQHEKQHQELVASYLQRYCTKNDSIGFFGPIGWAKFVDQEEPMALSPGEGLLATRKVYFESWPIESLANAITKDRNIYPWLAPIRMPFIRLEGDTLHHSAFGAMNVSASQAVILEYCDGVRTAKEIAELVLHSGQAQFRSEVEIYKSLGELAARRLVFWNFSIPFGPYPEKVLRQALERVQDEKLRERSLAMLQELDAARDSVEKSAGDPVALESALSGLEETFTRLTGVAAVRGHGKTYAARTPVYEDCRRDIEVRLGTKLLHELSSPLTLLLTSARWLTAGVTAIYKQKFAEIYDELAALKGSHQVDATSFWMRAVVHLLGEKGVKPMLASPVLREFQKKWKSILNYDPQAREVHYSIQELSGEVAREFSAPAAGWTEGRYHCPDLLIAASGEEAVRRGDYLLVMGELHAGWNTIAASLFVQQHPAPQELVRAVEHDLGVPNVVPMPPKSSDLLSRTIHCLMSPSDFRLEYSADSFAVDRSHALPLSSLVIEKDGDTLIAKTRDSRMRLNLMNMMGAIFGELVIDSFKIMAPGLHTPRIIIDKLVIKRESWQFAPSELAFACEPDSAGRFLRARAWAASCGLPRFVFCKLPVERKPSFLDLESPILVDIFCKMVRRTLEADIPGAVVEVSEMLPTPEQLWLRDADDNRYTCELRIVALDLVRGETLQS